MHGSERKRAPRSVSYSESLANLRRMAADIEQKMSIARQAAKHIGKDVALIRDSVGRLRMVFVQSIETSERLAENVKEAKIAKLNGYDREMGSEVEHLGGFRERGPARMAAWPAQGYAFPRRGFIAPTPRGYAELYRTHPVPRW